MRMKLSPVQLIDTFPVKILVEYNPIAPSDDVLEKTQLDIEHMSDVEVLTINAKDGGTLNTYSLMLGLRSGDASRGIMPYSFEIIVRATITIDSTLCKADTNINDLATKNGLTMLYGQVRELLLSSTSRMKRGAFMLPTMSFMDATFNAPIAADSSSD